MKTALLVIATGERYVKYVNPLLESAREFFVEHDAIVWTDDLHDIDAKFVLTKAALGFPKETLYRYHTLLQQEWLLKKYDHLQYIDADMRFVAPVGEEVFSKGLTGIHHPGYCGERGTPERNPDSTAAIPYNAMNDYFCGGFQGGESSEFLKAAETMARNIDLDSDRGLIAIWNDESHWNRYLYDNPPAKILGPDYCYPEDAGSHYKDKWARAGLTVTPKILALTKDKS